MKYETSVGEFVQLSCITVLKGFKRWPIGACDTVGDRRDMIAWLNVRCDRMTAKGKDCREGKLDCACRHYRVRRYKNKSTKNGPLGDNGEVLIRRPHIAL